MIWTLIQMQEQRRWAISIVMADVDMCICLDDSHAAVSYGRLILLFKLNSKLVFQDGKHQSTVPEYRDDNVCCSSFCTAINLIMMNRIFMHTKILG